MESDPSNGLTDAELADLARLADGTLPAERQAEVEARVSASPELAQMVARQAAAMEAVRSTSEIGAPARLRAEIDRRRGAARGWMPRRAPGRRGIPARLATIGAAAALVIAVTVVVPGVFQGGPSVADAATLAEKPPTKPPPAGEPGTPALLAAKVDDVPFPDYSAKFGWKPAGARQDEPDGRGATTVYYAKGRRTVAYTIVSGDALDPPSHASVTERAGVEYRTFEHDGRTAVTWERDGQTCVLSADGVRAAELVALADWRGKGAIPF